MKSSLFLFVALFSFSAMATDKWTKIMSCENGQMVLDTDMTQSPSPYQLVIRENLLEQMLKSGSLPRGCSPRYQYGCTNLYRDQNVATIRLHKQDINPSQAPNVAEYAQINVETAINTVELFFETNQWAEGVPSETKSWIFRNCSKW